MTQKRIVGAVFLSRAQRRSHAQMKGLECRHRLCRPGGEAGRMGMDAGRYVNVGMKTRGCSVFPAKHIKRLRVVFLRITHNVIYSCEMVKKLQRDSLG